MNTINTSKTTLKSKEKVLYLVTEKIFDYNDEYYQQTEGVCFDPTLYINKNDAEKVALEYNRKFAKEVFEGDLSEYLISGSNIPQYIFPNANLDTIVKILYPKEFNKFIKLNNSGVEKEEKLSQLIRSENHKRDLIETELDILLLGFSFLHIAEVEELMVNT